MNSDQRTADAFATSWNNLPAGSVYTREQSAYRVNVKIKSASTYIV